MTNIRRLTTLTTLIAAFAVSAGAQVPVPAPPSRFVSPPAFVIPPLPPLPLFIDPTELLDEVRDAIELNQSNLMAAFAVQPGAQAPGPVPSPRPPSPPVFVV